MNHQKKVVYGVFESHAALEKAVSRIQVEGCDASDVSVLFPHGRQAKKWKNDRDSTAARGVVVGGVTGLILDGALGWLVGVGTLAVPGIGVLLAAGPILAALTGAGAGGMVGSLSRAIARMGMSEHEAKRYETFVKAGGTLIFVACSNEDDIERTIKTLNNTGATDISSTAEAPGKESDGVSRVVSWRISNGVFLCASHASPFATHRSSGSVFNQEAGSFSL